MVLDGTLIELNRREYPNCYLHRSSPSDVARTESSTFICTQDKDDAGPTNNWMEVEEALSLLWKLFAGCMTGRVMYVIPYLLGPLDSRYSQCGVQITDSPYVVANLRIITRAGAVAVKRLNTSSGFVRGIHSMGSLDPNHRYICHFPDSRLILSINSNYGGNALLSKKCHSLRIASVMGKEEGWLAEHMLIVGLEDAAGKTTYITGAFPSACGKTNLAMLKPPAGLAEFKVWMLGDDIAWLHLSPDGTFHAVNPEFGLFCVAAGTSMKSNPNLMRTIRSNTLFTNVALGYGRRPWWQGKGRVPQEIWTGRGGPGRATGSPAAHPNARLTTPISQYRYLSPRSNDPDGVQVSAIIFGVRRSKSMPLVYEAFDWEQGVLAGAMMISETTAAAAGDVGVQRHDPMAMLPFCGYNMGHYFRHWLSFASRSRNLPRIFRVNWFRTGRSGELLWPGFRENIRVLKWIVERTQGRAEAAETAIGYVPTLDSLDLRGLDISREVVDEALSVNREDWLRELDSCRSFFETFGDSFPKELWTKYWELAERVQH